MQNRIVGWRYSVCFLVLLLGIQVPRQEILANTVEESLVSKESRGFSESLCPSDLKTAIETVINRPEFKRSRWGILIQTLDSGEMLYSLDAEKYFIPASSVKLLTTAAALLQLGSQFRIRTSVYGTGDIANLNTLRLVGKGDPSFSSDRLKDLAQQLKRQGVHRISNVIVEDNYFEQTGINSSWEWGDIFFSYGTSINSLILNENSVTLTLSPREPDFSLKVDWSDPIAARQWQIENQTITASEETSSSIEIQGNFGRSFLEIQGEMAIDSEPTPWELAIVDPNQYFLESFLEALIAQGIKVERGAIAKESKENSLGKELAFIESDPLSVLLQKTNRESNNLFAEVLLQILGSESHDKMGLEVVKEKLTELGVNPESYVLADGSGLSRHNLVSPEAIAQTLRLMAQTPEAKTYQDSLAVAGVSGTLQERFKNTLVAENLQGKTGTLSGNSALSGYLTVPGYRRLVFSIIVNQSDRPASDLRAAIDEIIVSISQLKSCQEKRL
ncbi:D-alanyl-D-alanine carboxypeptidase, serine-type, PBP4 family [Pleurocapsa sp. PCC 7327]|uniref:D-alanyl-D-alanine carboxypeptidase/D-alanyl-D-alanine endopeptidase n=1 Tax=Pleurocapsa sp. PCC 7327 TaxID=118163 RepID=UPI00029F9EE5|nr:D-alanyl-D-alanine carboxypeptidase/D-alanyl-D-alanine-endopeptidase [Pleurocapsa sp. PCC 7327]AFY77587.1 D-alanyl-D-alanine carboxypeptidase, serine-type, PBP4 family [Pleurocapsa sp. PCC 7327]